MGGCTCATTLATAVFLFHSLTGVALPVPVTMVSLFALGSGLALCFYVPSNVVALELGKGSTATLSNLLDALGFGLTIPYELLSGRCGVAAAVTGAVAWKVQVTPKVALALALTLAISLVLTLALVLALALAPTFRCLLASSRCRPAWPARRFWWPWPSKTRTRTNREGLRVG